MPLLLDEVRKEFAKFLYEQSDVKYSMDRALGHVVELAYKQGVNEGITSSENIDDELCAAILDVCNCLLLDDTEKPAFTFSKIEALQEVFLKKKFPKT